MAFFNGIQDGTGGRAIARLRCAAGASMREPRFELTTVGVGLQHRRAVYLSAAAAPLGTFCRPYADRARICLPAKPLCPIATPITSQGLGIQEMSA